MGNKNNNGKLHYDYGPILSYNRLLNFIVGARRCGKTFGFKDWAVDDFLKTGNQFIYMRRSKKELEDPKAKALFFPLALKQKYPDHEMCFDKGAYLIDGKIAGYPMVLSTAGKEKSNEYDLVNKVCFDEFIISKQLYHYLPDETRTFLEALVTISGDILNPDRKLKIFFIANAVSWNNPYFLKWNIPKPENGEQWVKGKSFVLHKPDMSAFKEEVKKTVVGQALQELDPEYFSYAFDNEVLMDNNDFIRPRPAKSSYMFSITYKGVRVGVWVDFVSNAIYCSNKFDKSNPRDYVIDADEHTEKTVLLLRRNSNIDMLCNWFQQGLVYFEDQRIKGVIYDFMKKYM